MKIESVIRRRCAWSRRGLVDQQPGECLASTATIGRRPAALSLVGVWTLTDTPWSARSRVVSRLQPFGAPGDQRQRMAALGQLMDNCSPMPLDAPVSGR